MSHLARLALLLASCSWLPCAGAVLRLGWGGVLVGVQAAGEAPDGGYSFELVELSAPGAAKVHPINGTVSCGKGCHGCGAGTNLGCYQHQGVACLDVYIIYIYHKRADGCNQRGAGQ